MDSLTTLAELSSGFREPSLEVLLDHPVSPTRISLTSSSVGFSTALSSITPPEKALLCSSNAGPSPVRVNSSVLRKDKGKGVASVSDDTYHPLLPVPFLDSVTLLGVKLLDLPHPSYHRESSAF